MKLARSGASGWLALGPPRATSAGISARGRHSDPPRGSATAAPREQLGKVERESTRAPGAPPGRLQRPQLPAQDAGAGPESAFLAGSQMLQVRHPL